MADDLVHVVVLIGRQPTNKPNIAGLQCEIFVEFEQLGVFWQRDRIIRVAVIARVLTGDACLRSRGCSRGSAGN